MEADASRYHGKAPDEIDWSGPERQTRAVAEFLSGLDDEDPDADRKPPKVISKQLRPGKRGLLLVVVGGGSRVPS
jgi:hypothetical protein